MDKIATFKHVMIIIFFVLNIWIWWKRFNVDGSFDNSAEYGSLLIGLYAIRLLHRIPRLHSFANIFGILFYNPFTVRGQITQENKNAYTHVFRVVTKGLDKNLVRKTARKNLEIIKRMGMKNFKYEVVTSSHIGFENNQDVKEILVPENYKTKNGALFKGRLLHYCLEPEMNTLSDNDWIIHLDEETQLTDSSVVGIMEFTCLGKHDFGQGTIVYTNEKVVNWVTTFGDLYRTGADYGYLRFCFEILHMPFFNWKGSFIVAKASSEVDVGFDFGPKGSITEDCTFGMLATSKGYSFGFIHGYMLEQSPFTIMDFINQRGRWHKGLTLGVMLKFIPFKNKIGILLMIINCISCLTAVPDFVLSVFFPLYFPPIIHFLIALHQSDIILTITLGVIKSFDIKQYGYIRVLVIWLFAMICMPLTTIMEACGMVSGFTSLNKIEFYSVVKETDKLTKAN